VRHTLCDKDLPRRSRAYLQGYYKELRMATIQDLNDNSKRLLLMKARELLPAVFRQKDLQLEQDNRLRSKSAPRIRGRIRFAAFAPSIVNESSHYSEKTRKYVILPATLLEYCTAPHDFCSRLSANSQNYPLLHSTSSECFVCRPFAKDH
jgi:hypothetical protein